jgi:superfamily II DNA or RNA helicase
MEEKETGRYSKGTAYQMITKAVKNTHLWISKSECTDLDRLKRSMTVRSRYEDGPIVHLFRETATAIGLPLYHPGVRDLKPQVVIDKTSSGSSITFKMRTEPRPDQRAVINRFLQLTAENETGIILNMRTGGGKTWLGIKFIETIGLTTLVIVPREFIMEQWIERILEHTTLTRDDIGIVQQGTCQYKAKKVSVGLIHSLCKDKYSDDFRRWPGIVLLDEIHTAGAKEFSNVLKIFPAKYRFGLTATLERKDGMTPVYTHLLGGSIIRVGEKHKHKPTIIKVRYLYVPSLPRWLSKVQDKVRRRGVIVSALAGDIRRNRTLFLFIRAGLLKGRRILVLSDRKDQLKLLYHMIRDLTEKVDLFVQETKQSRRKEIIETSQVILATYQIFSMAVDLKYDFSTLVLATPISDAEQSVGRIMREGAGKLNPVVIDFEDATIKDCRNWSNARNKLWYTMDSTIREVDESGRAISR